MALLCVFKVETLQADIPSDDPGKARTMTKTPSEKDEGHPVNPPHSQLDIPASPGSREAMTMECKSIAEELLRVLQRETSCLRRFDSQELLRILPAKELLLRELMAGLRCLKLCTGELTEEQAAPHFEGLRRSLENVRRASQFNEVFIRGSLDYWQGLMAVFSPQTYGPGPGLSSNQPSPATRGFTFSKEA